MYTSNELWDIHKERMFDLFKLGYEYDPELSISYCGVVYRKDDDLYVFGLDGKEYHFTS